MRLLVSLLAVLALAGCSLGGDDGGPASIERSELPRLVLQPGDLPKVFIQFDEGRQALADTPTGERSDPLRFRRVEGWKSRYRRPGSARTAGPLVIESRADLFEDSEGAEKELEAMGESGFVEVESPALGDEARVFETRQAGLANTVAYYLVAWREDNVTALLLASGFSGRFRLEEAIELARKQQRHLAAAAG